MYDQPVIKISKLGIANLYLASLATGFSCPF